MSKTLFLVFFILFFTIITAQENSILKDEGIQAWIACYPEEWDSDGQPIQGEYYFRNTTEKGPYSNAEYIEGFECFMKELLDLQNSSKEELVNEYINRFQYYSLDSPCVEINKYHDYFEQRGTKSFANYFGQKCKIAERTTLAENFWDYKYFQGSLFYGREQAMHYIKQKNIENDKYINFQKMLDFCGRDNGCLNFLITDTSSEKIDNPKLTGFTNATQIKDYCNTEYTSISGTQFCLKVFAKSYDDSEICSGITNDDAKNMCLLSLPTQGQEIL